MFGGDRGDSLRNSVEAMIGVVHGDVDRDSRGEHDTGVDRGKGGHGGVGGEADGGGG
jgi:hypothetical protein